MITYISSEAQSLMDGQTDKVSYRASITEEQTNKVRPLQRINKDDNIHKSEALKR